MRSNVRNGVNLGFDTELHRHRLLGSLTLASWAFCFGTIAGVSAADASILTLQDAARAMFEAKMDEELAREGIFETLKHVNPKLFAQQMIQQVGYNVDGAFDVLTQYVPDGGDGFIKSMTDNPAAQLANDLIMEPDEKMDWLSPILKTAALGFTVYATALTISRASSVFKAWLVSSSEEYFEKRKALLISGRAVKSDINKTRERAVQAYAGLIAFERRGGQAVLETPDLNLARLSLEDLPLGEVLKKLEVRMEGLREARLKDLERAIYAGDDPASVGPVRMRDILRDVIMDRSSTVVDPFAPASSGPAPT